MTPGPDQSHYFSRHAPVGFRVFIDRLWWHGTERPWATGPGVFARGRLDRGTELMIDAIEMRRGEKLLDLGCGTGAVGVLIHERFEGIVSILSDVAQAALACASRNVGRAPAGQALVVATSGYDTFREGVFDVIALNPPIRAGRSVVAPLLRKAPDYLAPGGRFYMVARTAQGAATLERVVGEAFGRAPILVSRKAGYRVTRATRPEDDGGAPSRESQP